MSNAARTDRCRVLGISEVVTDRLARVAVQLPRDFASLQTVAIEKPTGKELVLVKMQLEKPRGCEIVQILQRDYPEKLCLFTSLCHSDRLRAATSSFHAAPTANIARKERAEQLAQQGRFPFVSLLICRDNQREITFIYGFQTAGSAFLTWNQHRWFLFSFSTTLQFQATFSN